MKHSSTAASVMSKVKFREKALENYFNNLDGLQASDKTEKFTAEGYNALVWGSAHACASGSLEIVFTNSNNDSIVYVEIPVHGHFLVTGTRWDSGKFKLTFCMSMS